MPLHWGNCRGWERALRLLWLFQLNFTLKIKQILLVKSTALQTWKCTTWQTLHSKSHVSHNQQMMKMHPPVPSDTCLFWGRCGQEDGAQVFQVLVGFFRKLVRIVLDLLSATNPEGDCMLESAYNPKKRRHTTTYTGAVGVKQLTLTVDPEVHCYLAVCPAGQP